jgi:hypothetical protein
MPLRNWNTDNVLPASSDELDKLIAACHSADEVKAVCKEYAERKGLITTSPDGIHSRTIPGAVDPDARGFSVIVTVRGQRKLLTGARSQQELDAAIERLKQYE